MSPDSADAGRPAAVQTDGRSSDASATIVAALDRLCRARRVHRQTVATDHGLTPLQIDLLIAVATGVPPTPSIGALAREFGVSQPTITDSIAALERKNLVVRHAAMSDRRQRVVSLTEHGVPVVDELDRADRTVRAAVVSTDPHEQAATLRTLLDIIARFVDAGVIEVARTCVTCTFHRSVAGDDHCNLLGIDLAPTQLRVDCPDHVPASA